MPLSLDHLHLKAKDPEKTMRFYVDNLGAKIIPISPPAEGYRLDLDGLHLRITSFNKYFKHEQFYGLEHLAINTNEMDEVVAKLADKGVQILEETLVAQGTRRVCFFEGPDGEQIEFIEKPLNASVPPARSVTGRTRIPLSLDHLHLKSRNPEKTMQFYVDHVGAKVISVTPLKNGYRLDLHGLQLRVTLFNEGFKHEQFYGLEHLAINTYEMDERVAKLKAKGVKILEETLVRHGTRRVCFFEGPDGEQIEFIEKPLKAAA